MSTPTLASTRPRANALPAVIVALAALVGSVGAVVSSRAVLSRSHEAATIGTIGDSIVTSFGHVAVEHAEHIKGVTAQDVAGGVHGVNGLVRAGDEQIQVTVQLTSGRSRSTARYNVNQFRLVVGRDRRTVSPSSATLPSGVLQPYASVEGHLGFVVPGDGARLWLRFDDLGNAPPVLIDLGTTDDLGPVAVPTHH